MENNTDLLLNISIGGGLVWLLIGVAALAALPKLRKEAQKIRFLIAGIVAALGFVMLVPLLFWGEGIDRIIVIVFYLGIMSAWAYLLGFFGKKENINSRSLVSENKGGSLFDYVFGRGNRNARWIVFFVLGIGGVAGGSWLSLPDWVVFSSPIATFLLFAIGDSVKIK
jgi:hypothetical protein